MNAWAQSFEIIRELGEGGMGRVYLARQLSLNRDVALKVLNLGQETADVLVRRFAQEAHAMKRLRHENVIQLYDFHFAGRESYLALEFVPDAQPLDAVLERRPLDRALRLGIVRQLVAGMVHLHENAILHRDLKPSNVLVTPGGLVKVIDFGLGKDLTATERTVLTRDGQTLGTLSYMPPEQFLGEPATPRSDVYALAEVILEVLAGRRLFKTGGNGITPFQRSRGEIPSPSKLCPGIDPRIDRLISKCLSIQPPDRPESAAAMQRLLNLALDGDADRSEERTRVFTAPAAPSRLQGGRRAPWKALGVTALAASLIAVTTVARSRPRGMVIPATNVSTSSGSMRIEGPSLRLVNGEVRAVFETSLPVRAEVRSSPDSGPPAKGLEPDPVTHHDVRLGAADAVPAMPPALVLMSPDGPRTVAVPVAEREAFARRLVRLLGDIRMHLERRLAGDRSAWDPPSWTSLGEVLPDRNEFLALRSASPWIRAAQLDSGISTGTRVALTSGIADLQPYDRLCPGPFRTGSGEIHALLPEAFRMLPNDASSETGRRFAAGRESTPNQVLGMRDIEHHVFQLAHLVSAGKGFEGMELFSIPGPVELSRTDGGELDGSADRLERPVTTGDVAVDLPASMVRPGRLFYFVTQHWCDEPSTFQRIEINRDLRLMNDPPCGTGEWTAAALEVARLVPLEALRPGRNTFRITLVPILPRARPRSIQFYGFKLYALSPAPDPLAASPRTR